MQYVSVMVSDVPPRTITAPTEAWDRVADAVRTRREDLGLTASQLVDLAGGTPSLAVLSQIENGRRDRYASRTLRLLSNALSWTADSIDRILEGGDPYPQAAVGHEGDQAPEWWERLERVEKMLAELLAERDPVPPVADLSDPVERAIDERPNLSDAQKQLALAEHRRGKVRRSA